MDGSGSRSPHGVMIKFLGGGASREIVQMQNPRPPSPLWDSDSGDVQAPGVSLAVLPGESLYSGQSPGCGLRVPWLQVSAPRSYDLTDVT